MTNFSIITVTNSLASADNIHHTYQSLKGQSIGTWEWSLIFRDAIGSVPDEVKADQRVQLSVEAGKTIPAIKHSAYKAAKGQVILGVDIGDKLVPTSLQVLEEVMRTPGAYYSDFVIRRANGSFDTYKSEHGWESYSTTVAGEPVTAIKAFEPSVRSFSDLYFSPFRLQAWHRETYAQVGGYDAGSAAGEDLELWCRAYMHPSMPVIRRVPVCLYERYIDRVQVSEDQEKDNLGAALSFCNANMTRLILSEVARNGTAAWAVDADIPDHTRVSIDPRHWPINNKNSVGLIQATNVLSMLPHASLHEWMLAAYEALTPGGWLLIENPSTDGRGAFQNPMYTTFVNENTFFYFTHRSWAVPAFGPAYPARYQAVRLWTAAPGEWYKAHAIFNVRADLCALKGQRQPGPVNI